MTRAINRRIVLASGGAVAAAAIVPSSSASAATEIKPLPFASGSIPGLSEKLLVSHHDNNYAGAVRRFDAITAELAKFEWPNAPGFEINGLKREQLMAMNSAILHELYFAGLGAGGDTPTGALAEAITRDFGSAEAWGNEFAAMGKAQGGGSGWVLLTYSPRFGRLFNQWAADHTTTLANGHPILALDMYEHAYHMDYGAKAGAYVDAYMKVINWTNAAEEFSRAKAG